MFFTLSCQEEFEEFGGEDDGGGGGDDFEPGQKFEGDGIKGVAAELGDEDLEGEGGQENQRQGFVVGKFSEYADVIQVAAIKGVQELKD